MYPIYINIYNIQVGGIDEPSTRAEREREKKRAFVLFTKQKKKVPMNYA